MLREISLNTLKFSAYRLHHAVRRRISDTRYVLELTDPSPLRNRVRPAGTEIRFFCRADEAPDAAYVGQTPEQMSVLFDAGARLYTLYEGSQLASFGWTRRGVNIPHWTIQLNPEDIVVSRCFTQHAFRGKGYISDVIAAMINEEGRNGGGRFLTDVHVANTPSLNQFLRTGWRIVARAQAPRECPRP